MDFRSYLDESAKAIDKEVNGFLTNFRKKIGKLNKKLLPLVDTFIEANRGGKRLRGALIKLGYELTGKRYTPEILKPAAAVEIFQTAILAHDDIIDQSFIRRSRPTIYMALGGDHYAVSQAIVLGDIGFFLAVQLITDSVFDDKLKNQALSVFSQLVISTGLGEILDVELPRLKKIRTEKDVLTIHILKTAYYTFVYPLSIGWILGKGDKNMLVNFESFGHKLGLAFQIQDDILGVYGDEVQLGKSVTSDIEEGKNTLLITKALRNAQGEQKQILGQYYGKGKISQVAHQRIKQVFIATGALDYSLQKALEYVAEAKKVIPKITQDKGMAALLVGLADFLINRQR